LGFLALGPALAVAQDEGATSASLKYKVVPKWTIILPQETWTSATGSIAMPHAGGDGFVTGVDGMALKVDTNGDGKTDEKVKGVSDFLTLTSKNAEGGKVVYGVRFRKEGASWQYASSGFFEGRIGGETIRLIDQNNNGAFNDFGVDAMVVGRSEAASYLSRVVNLKGDLFHFDVTADGQTATIKPYTGEVGTLDLRSGFKSSGQLVSAIVTDSAGQASFDLARVKGAMKVPAGSYVISGGYATKGSETCRIRTGQMQPVEVKAQADAALAWGAPVAMEFNYTIEGETLKIAPPPQNVKYFGAAGEEYFDWKPDATSPEILVYDKKTGNEVAKGRFGGC
jgi:hypothetical protein